jgi:predicted unusual protein kinase regulating ubiquinone biosynthesis (AarF/ABC1/UbiB family)
MLSIDNNLLPAAYADQFSKAQYSAPPLSYPLVARTFRREMGRGPLEIFDSFSETAAHGASIGQVHRASKDGREFAVKVQYPGVAESLCSDLRIVKPIALQIIGVRERDVEGYFREVESRLLEETDYTLELRRSMELSRDTAHLEGVSFPRYFPEFSCRRILTMEWIDGLTLDRFAKSSASREERNRIGQALWDFYEFQIHTLRLFHADPHPGNFLVREGGLVVLDFGCTKKIEPDFYHRHFRFLDKRLLNDRASLEAALEDLNILLPGDSQDYRARLSNVCADSIEILARPFRDGCFDFSDAAFMRAIYDLGERNRRDESLKRLRGRRGSPDSVYVNRAYFGLYSLLHAIGARVQTRLPDWLRT